MVLGSSPSRLTKQFQALTTDRQKAETDRKDDGAAPGQHLPEFRAQAHWHHFHYRISELIGIDRNKREVVLAPYLDKMGREVMGRRLFPYDTLIIAIGSLGNDFSTPGVREYAIMLDSADEARRLHERLLDCFLRAQREFELLKPEQLNMAIIGAGATGTELAAELRSATHQLAAFGYDRIDPAKDITINLIEAADRILPPLPKRLADEAMKILQKLRVQVHTSARVEEVTAGGVRLANGTFFPAELIVWTAGVKAPDLLTKLDGLETNRHNQLVVLPTLQTTRALNIFAIGDCAACPWAGRVGKTVPPRAQAAHQQASYLARHLKRRLAEGRRDEQPWQYRDFGSLVSLGDYSTVGKLMGGVWVEGLIARAMYRALYKMHQIALHGVPTVLLDTLASSITRRTEPHPETTLTALSTGMLVSTVDGRVGYGHPFDDWAHMGVQCKCKELRQIAVAVLSSSLSGSEDSK